MKTHYIHLSEEERRAEDMRSGIEQLNKTLGNSQAIVYKGQDGKTPKKGVDYLTEAEMNLLKSEIGSMVVSYVLSQIPPPQHGRTPIAGADYPTVQQVHEKIEAMFARHKPKKQSKEERANETVDLINASKKLINPEQIKGLTKFLREVDEMGKYPSFGGGGGRQNGTFVWDEDLSAGGTASGTSFTLARVPLTGSVRLHRGGSRITTAASDYTVSGATITLTTSLAVGEFLTCDYSY